MRFTPIKPFHLYRQKIIYDVAQIFLRNSWQGIDIPFFSLWCSILYYLSSLAFIISTSGYRINNLASWQRYFLWTTSDANTTPGDRINVKGWMVLEASYLSLTQVGSSIHILWGSNSVKCASVSHSHSNIASEKYLQDHKMDNIIHCSCLIDFPWPFLMIVLSHYSNCHVYRKVPNYIIEQNYFYSYLWIHFWTIDGCCWLFILTANIRLLLFDHRSNVKSRLLCNSCEEKWKMTPEHCIQFCPWP